MTFFKSKQPEPAAPLPKSPHIILQQALTHLDSTFSHLQNHTKQAIEARFSRVHLGSYQTRLESTFSHLQNHTRQAIESGFSLFRSGFHQTHLESALSNFHSHAEQAIEAGFLRFRFNSRPNSSGKSPTWARIGENVRSRGVSMSNEDIEERLAGVPVYALSNSSGEFVLVSGLGTGKNLGLFCFKEEIAEALLQQMKSMEPDMRDGSKVVALALNKVFQLKLDDVAFRFVPDPSQIKYALEERRKAGFSDEVFPGVPVFQSRSLVLRSQNMRYRPVFFRREDLEKSLFKASREQNRLNPALREGDIQVAVLEEIIEGMKDNNTSTWDDVVFIPPGFDVSTDPFQK
ncbi:protein TIC 22-like, chloroplastic [Actinidia eriantha]|uniref:protein TIC 22-like, chloroplastic n=1 Tax=Actinidia eriantha TaxID=165200 RepID=UPI0025889EF0|nr:protein TIC 22-like, chloroplastic [Actinidia eriantha]